MLDYAEKMTLSKQRGGYGSLFETYENFENIAQDNEEGGFDNIDKESDSDAGSDVEGFRGRRGGGGRRGSRRGGGRRGSRRGGGRRGSRRGRHRRRRGRKTVNYNIWGGGGWPYNDYNDYGHGYGYGYDPVYVYDSGASDTESVTGDIKAGFSDLRANMFMGFAFLVVIAIILYALFRR